MLKINPNGIKEEKSLPHLVSNTDASRRPTHSKNACSELGIGQIFARYCNPKGNVDTARMMRTIKEDLESGNGTCRSRK